MEDKYQKSERPERRETKERSYQRKERTDIISVYTPYLKPFTQAVNSTKF